MNRPRPFASPGRLFGPAFQYFSNVTTNSRDRSTSRSRSHYRDPSIDDDDADYAVMEGGSSALDLPEENLRAVSPRPHRRGSSDDLALTPTRSIPLIDLSRSPSPYPRSRSAAQSEDEDEDADFPISLRPLIRDGPKPAFRSPGKGWRNIFREGGLGNFLFGTWIGYQIYVSLLVIWIGGCGFGLVLLNRFIMWTGTYKFPYPLTTTWIELLGTHILLLGWSSFTRAFQRPFQMLGLKGIVAPSTPGPTHSAGYRAGKPGIITALTVLFRPGTGGIAGGGMFEFDRKTALQVLPPAFLFACGVALSNLSFAYVVVPIYLLSRVAIVPLSLALTAFLTRNSHSVATLSSALSATFNLLMATIRLGVRVTWEGVITGILSSFFIALYPIILLRTQRSLASQQSSQGDLLPSLNLIDDSTTADPYTSAPAPESFYPVASREETRAYYLTLHYTSLLSLLILTPVVLFSGEPSNIQHNCYFLDVPWFWFLMLSGSFFAFTVFLAFLLLIKATSPMATTFVSVPAQALQLAVLGGKMPVHAWVGASLCWVTSLWFAGVRRAEARRWAVGVGAGLSVDGR